MMVSVISLLSNTERRKAFDERMKELGDYNYFDAFTPSDIGEFKGLFHYSDIYDYTAFTKPSAVIACAKSHFALWKKCFESGENLLILEDDALFTTPSSAGILSELEPPAGFDVVFLDGEVNEGEIDIVGVSGFHGCYAYLLSPKGAGILLQEIIVSGFSAAVDWQILRMDRSKLSVWMTTGAVFIHDFGFPSNIKQKSLVKTS